MAATAGCSSVRTARRRRPARRDDHCGDARRTGAAVCARLCCGEHRTGTAAVSPRSRVSQPDRAALRLASADRGVDRTLAFIALTIRGLHRIAYRAVEHAISSSGDSAFVRIHFDWTREGQRLRSNYVVIYRYRDGRIGQQELYYDPSGRIEDITAAA